MTHLPAPLCLLNRLSLSHKISVGSIPFPLHSLQSLFTPLNERLRDPVKASARGTKPQSRVALLGGQSRMVSSSNMEGSGPNGVTPPAM